MEPGLLSGGRYQIGPVIGRGGMAEVRSGRDTRLDRPVAVKLLRPDMAVQPGVRDRFEAEARLAARLNHPNVVSVYDSGEEDGVPFIVMERLPGPTLKDRMATGPMTTAEAQAMAVQVLAALLAAHEAGVLHRDVKPGNILAAPGDRWKVGDFGIAKAQEGELSDHTATGLLIGTPAYLAPERLFGAPATVASDLYAFGVVLFEALTGRRPYEPDGREAWGAAAGGRRPPPLRTLRPDVDPDLAEVVDRSLAPDPADRFWTAAEMESRLSGATAPAPRPEATALLPLGERVLGRRPAVRGLAARGLAAAAVAAVVVVAVAMSLSGGHGARTTPPSTAATAGSVGTAAPTTTTSTSTTTTSTTVPARSHPAPSRPAGPGGARPGPGGGGRHGGPGKPGGG